MNLPELRGKIAYQTSALALTALVVSAALSMADRGTQGAIARHKAQDLQASLMQVIPAQLYDGELLDDMVTVPMDPGAAPLSIYRARHQGEISALAFTVVGQGYAGPIEALVGVDRQGHILGVRVISHQETPGLGDKIEHRKSDWIFGFDGRSLTDPAPQAWSVKKDGGVFDQLTGATITPRAVVQAVKHGLEFFAAHQGQLLENEPRAGAPTREVRDSD
jgi:electron transport complex protein RnfG